MNNMSNLYRQVIMEHYKSPRNKGLTGSGKQNHLRNPSCGDDITVEVEIENNKIKHVHHDGAGCSICCSSASVMSEVLTGKDVDEAKSIINDYCNMIKGEEVLNEDALEEALVYQGVAAFPARMKCATIAWKAVEELLGEEDE
jgi:SUF system NifU family Fe-S assembly protein